LSQEWQYVSRTFNGEEHQNCSATRKGLRAIPYNVQRVEGKKEAAAITVFLKRKEENKKTQITLFGGGGVWGFVFFEGGFGT